MATTDPVIRLKPETFEALEAEAERRHVEPNELADELVRDQLETREERRRRMRAALDRLAELRKTMPEVDAAQLIRDIRVEEADRGLRWRSS
jgi:flagellar motility protein MotE (MotC chaperone)